MFNRRFNLYIVGICFVAILSVSYIGIKTYQKHVKIAHVHPDFQTYNRSVDERYVHTSKDHTHGGEDKAASGKVKMAENEHNHSTRHNEFPHIYELSDGTYIESMEPKSKEELELDEWIESGKLTPYVEQELKRRAASQQEWEMRVRQRVVTPDGNLGEVIVPADMQYEEGDAILQSELVTPESHPNLFRENSWRGEGFFRSLLVDSEGDRHSLPDEYYEITDKYEREEYFRKFEASIDLGIPMDEVEEKIEAGELDVSLSDADKQYVDELSAKFAATDERLRLLNATGQKPQLSDKSPVKVSFLPKTGYLPVPGWLRKGALSDVEADEPSIDESPSTLEASPKQPEAENQVNRDVAPSFSRSRDEAEDVPAMPDNLTPENIESQLKEQLSLEQFLKAQRLLDEHGPEKGLRKFREIAPDAGVQFDREREPSRDAPDAP